MHQLSSARKQNKPIHFLCFLFQAFTIYILPDNQKDQLNVYFFDTRILFIYGWDRFV